MNAGAHRALCLLMGMAASATTASSTPALALVESDGPPSIDRDRKADEAPERGWLRLSLGVKTFGYFLTTSKWPTTDLTVCWEKAPRLPEARWVEDAVNRTWVAASPLRFSGWETTCNASSTGAIRIGVRDAGARTLGLGTQLAGVKDGMRLNFTFKKWNQPCAASEAERKACIEQIAIHEFGHAIGIAHEQNHPGAPGECAKRRSGTNGDLELTPYDPESVMNYCNRTYLNAGLLSERDKETVAAAYPRRT